MPKAIVSGALSIIILATWSIVYFSSRAPAPTQFTKTIKGEFEYDVFYPMDDAGLSNDDASFHAEVASTRELDQNNVGASASVNLEATTAPIYVVSSPDEAVANRALPKQRLFYDYVDEIETTTTRRSSNKTDHLNWMGFKNVTVVQKREHVKKMMKHAWDNYVAYAWGKNELKPISKRDHPNSVVGTAPIGLTIVDSLDTLYMMGLMDEYKKGRDWIANELDVTSLTYELSVFEVNIRLVGGLLTCYALTGEALFRDNAQKVADKLLPAFNTATGIPYALVDFETGSGRNYGWAGGASILSEFGTLHLEFAYLSDVTGNSIYRNKTEHIRKFVFAKKKDDGLYPNYLNPRTGAWGQYHYSMGSLGDSFYEYLLKAWLQSNKEDVEARQMYDAAMQAIMEHMLQTSPGGLTYFAEKNYDRLIPRMEHLACFSGGILALGAKTLSNQLTDRYMEVAENITFTCHESYDRSKTKLGPEAFRFDENLEARAPAYSGTHYILRPEVVESYFYLYRLTKNRKYRDWGWEAVQALERHCRVDGGYTGIKNVYEVPSLLDDVQQSFFLAETLKYLYLLFEDDDVFSLDEWVFNTEAHPLPIKDVNPYYRAA